MLKRDFLFAVRCLCDTGRLGVDDDLRKSLIDELIALWRTTPYEPQRQEVVALFAYAIPTVDGERIREELLHGLDNPNMRQAAVGALGRLGAAAATPATLERLLALTADRHRDVRWAAVRALGELGAAAATPATLERLVALIADPDTDVRWAAAWALGSMEVSKELWESLGEFWQAHLANAEFTFIGEQFGRVCDIAYEQLQQIAARMAGQHDSRQGRSYNPG